VRAVVHRHAGGNVIIAKLNKLYAQVVANVLLLRELFHQFFAGLHFPNHTFSN
jgi:hypothetical protein